MTYVVEAAGAATSPVVGSLVDTHHWRAENSRVTAWTRPSGIALACFTRGRTRRTAAAARMSVVAAEALSKLLLAELLRLMQTHHKLLRPDGDAVHRVHRRGSCGRYCAE